MIDPVMRDLDNYLDACDAQEAFEEAAEELQMDLIKPGAEFYPFTGSAVSEALGEASDEQWEIIGKYMGDEANAVKLWQYIEALASSYWYAQAEDTAIKTLHASFERSKYED